MLAWAAFVSSIRGNMMHLLLITAALSLGFQATDPTVTVARVYAAFNAHDAGGFVEQVSEDIRWLTVTRDGVKVETTGREALSKYLARYFETTPGVSSRIQSSFFVGSHVAVHERVTWQSPRGERSQSAMAVYEVVNGRITRVWYYDAVAP